MNLNERSCVAEETGEFRLRIYHKSELARMYFPQSRQKTASQNLSRWIQGCPELWEASAAWVMRRHGNIT